MRHELGLQILMWIGRVMVVAGEGLIWVGSRWADGASEAAGKKYKR